MATSVDSPNYSAPASTMPYPNVALYVGDLASDVTETNLFDIFQKMGPISSVRICRDAATRKSLGYGYVNFHDPAHAEEALTSLSFTKIKGRPCRVMRSVRDPTSRKSQVGNLFIKGLADTVDSNGLTNLMSTFEGSVQSVRVPYKTDSNGNIKSCGYGFVQFATEEEAKNAIARVAKLGGKLGSNDVTIEPYRPRQPQDPSKQTNLYIKNIPATFTRAAFDEILAKFGKTTSVLLVSNEDGSCKGYGYAAFSSNAEAQACINELNGTKLPGVEGDGLYIAFYKNKNQIERDRKLNQVPNKAYPQGHNIYVKNLADTVDEAALKAEFARFGAITSCVVRRDAKLNVSLGFGFICFETAESATAAVDGIGRGYLFHNKPLYIAIAQNKAQRAEYLRLNYNYMQQQQQQQTMYNMVPYGYQPRPFFGAPPAYAGNPAGPQGGARLVPAAALSQPYPYQQAPFPRPGPGGNAAFPSAPGGQPYPRQPRAQGGPTQQGPGPYPQGQRPYGGGRQGGPGGFPPQGQQQAGFGGPVSFQQQPQQQQQQQQTRAAPRQPAAPTAQPQQQPQQAQAQPQRLPLNAQTLANMQPEQAKRTIGEAIYPKIVTNLTAENKGRAGKITGMLLEALDITELLNLLEDSKALEEKLSEALRVLSDADTQAATSG